VKWFLSVMGVGVGINLLSSAIEKEGWTWLPPAVFTLAAVTVVPRTGLLRREPHVIVTGRAAGSPNALATSLSPHRRGRVWRASIRRERRNAMLRLSEVIEELRGELLRAMASGEDQALRFEVGEVTLEVAVAVERETSGKGGVRFWVLELGAEGRHQAADTQTVRLTLHPKVAATGEKPDIAGEGAAGER
jgi:hypothetical protein